jgi:replication factor C small subunit
MSAAPCQASLWNQEITYKILTEQLADPSHLFFTGPAGSGKSTLIHDFLEMFYEYHKQTQKKTPETFLWLSSEKDRGIHVIREKVNDFCRRSPAYPGQIRWIILDDADSLPLISQQALRRPMETYSHLTKFIFASRQLSHLISPLRSRCLTLELEPVSIYDSLPRLCSKFSVQPLPQEIINWFYSFSPTTYKAIPILKLVGALQKENKSIQEILLFLRSFQFSSEPLAIDFVKSLVKRDLSQSIQILISLFFNGFLLDDILIALEKSLQFYPMLGAEKRFLILKFIMRGWISIQQGKEYWLDTMDILFDCLADSDAP